MAFGSESVMKAIDKGLVNNILKITTLPITETG